MKTILVIAGNYEEFRNWLKLPTIKKEANYKYATSKEALYGLHIDRVIEIGTCYRREDYLEIKRRAELMIRK